MLISFQNTTPIRRVIPLFFHPLTFLCSPSQQNISNVSAMLLVPISPPSCLSFNLFTYCQYMPGTVPHAGNTAMNKAIPLPSWSLDFS